MKRELKNFNVHTCVSYVVFEATFAHTLHILIHTLLTHLSLSLSLPLSSPQIKLRHADQEIRLAQDPFPLFPGEVLKQIVTQLKVVPANTALRLRAVLDFVEGVGTKRTAGDEWLFEGPGES